MFFPQAISDVILVKPKRFGDDRGFFSETFRADSFEEARVHGPFVQDNHSLSRQQGVLRGLHFQTAPHAQAKLVRCTRGAILDVAVDIRTGSPTYGQYVSAELTAENGWQLYVPVGFAHGFVTRAEDTEVQYKVTDYYAPDCDGGFAWNDPAIGVDWGLNGETPVLSEKDAKAPLLSALPDLFQYKG